MSVRLAGTWVGKKHVGMSKVHDRQGARGFLARLLRDARGNTIALVTAAMIPLLGLIGGGVDMSRIYLTKTRLQQACDAGALAGRKAMGTGSWTTGANSTEATALAMFDGNFQQGDYGTGTRTRTFTESDGEVTGTVSAVIPMAVMKVFGVQQRTINVTCTADMEIPNTDVMFVLDVTGSMAWNIPGESVSKISGLRSAVKCFYEALVKVNTAEVCGGDPTAATYDGTAQIRIGFVPYSVNVNVGKLLPNSYLADSWAYQSRKWEWSGTYTTTNTGWIHDSGSYSTASNSNADSCPTDTYSYSDVTSPTTTVNNPDGSVTTSYTVTRTHNGTNVTSCYTKNNGKKSYNSTTYSNYVANITYTTVPVYSWKYQQITFDVSGLKAGGSTWNNSVTLPIGSNGSDSSIGWDGCIEERQTVKNSDGDPSDEWYPIPNAALDMDIDTVPSSTTGTQWGPLLRYAVWARYDWSGDTTSVVTTTSNLNRNFNYYCPTQARKLQTWTTSSAFETYVNSLSPTGNTYHDIGMLWGARFISPTGIFAAENTNLNNIQRHIIFMTDGDTNTCKDDYNAYGVGWWDRRQTTYAPSGSCSDGDLTAIVNARLESLCTTIRARNITLWVISYGSVSGGTATRLQNCASPGRYFTATSTATLMSNFKQIASEIADLRLTN